MERRELAARDRPREAPSKGDAARRALEFSIPAWVWALGAIVVLALALRVWGIRFGLPFLYHPDEGALVMPALKVLTSGDYRPARLDYGSAYLYSLVALYIPYFVYGVWRGLFTTVGSLPVMLDYHQIGAYPYPVFFLIARLLTAVTGSLTVLPVFAIGRRLAGRRAGLAAAALLAVAPVHAVNSHFATTDVPATFLVALAIWRLLDLLERGSARDYFWSGTLVGLAASTKFPAGLVLGALLVAHVLRARRWADLPNGRLALSLAAVAGGFLLGTPYALDLPYFLNWLAVNVSFYGGPPGGGVSSSALSYYARELLLGPLAPIGLLGVVGCLWLLWRDWRRSAILLAYPLLHLGLVSVQVARWQRFVIPLVPFLAIGAGTLLVVVVERLSVRAAIGARSRASRYAAYLAAISLAALFPLTGTLRADGLLAAPDVRTKAFDWYRTNIGSEARVAADLMGPPVTAPAYNVTLSWNVAEHDAAWYRAQGYAYVIISEALLLDPNLSPAGATAYQALQRDLPLARTFEGPMLGIGGLHIWIYQVTP